MKDQKPLSEIKWPEKMEILDEESKPWAENRARSGWNACHDEFMKVINAQPFKGTDLSQEIKEHEQLAGNVVKEAMEKGIVMGLRIAESKGINQCNKGVEQVSVTPVESQDASVKRCPDCRGTGNLKHSTNPALIGSVLCWKCHGSGSVPKENLVNECEHQWTKPTTLGMQMCMNQGCTAQRKCPDVDMKQHEAHLQWVIDNKNKEIEKLYELLNEAKLSAKQDLVKLDKKELSKLFSPYAYSSKNVKGYAIEIMPDNNEFEKLINSICSTFGTSPPSRVPSVEEIIEEMRRTEINSSTGTRLIKAMAQALFS